MRLLDDASRGALLDSVCGLGTDADITHPLRDFLPLPEHRRALELQFMIVRGERGAGKTALFHVLGYLEKNKLPWSEVFVGAPKLEMRWVEGYSETKAHPSREGVLEFARTADDEVLACMWKAHLIGSIASSSDVPCDLAFYEAWQTRRTELSAWMPLFVGELGSADAWLDRCDQHLEGADRYVFVSYDHLDRIGTNFPAVRARLISTLLQMWLSLMNRYGRIRAKVFLRNDLFDKSLRSAPDASKLKARSVSLGWSVENLYRVLIRHMSNDEKLHAWLTHFAGVPLRQDAQLGWLPPDNMPEEDGQPCTQKSFATALAGEFMGSGVSKGYTHRWIPNHLQDAYKSVLPRSILRLLANAATSALKRGPRGVNRLFAPEELVAGLEETSKDRGRELAEEYPVVERLELLRGLTVMAELDEVVDRLTPSAQHDEFGSDGRAVLDELVRLGVLLIRNDGRVDVPDLYRYGYGIKRKGGVARPK